MSQVEYDNIYYTILNIFCTLFVILLKRILDLFILTLYTSLQESFYSFTSFL